MEHILQWTTWVQYLINSIPPNSVKKSDTHFIFGGIHSEFQPFTNWYPCSVEFKGHHFESSEQAYQWAKSDHCKDAAAAEKLLYATSPREAKDLGAEVEELMESDWVQKKNNVIEQILRIKFTDNAELKQLLLDSGNCGSRQGQPLGSWSFHQQR